MHAETLSYTNLTDAALETARSPYASAPYEIPGYM